jgi:hypothetical protein
LNAVWRNLSCIPLNNATLTHGPIGRSDHVPLDLILVVRLLGRLRNTALVLGAKI